MSDLVHAVHIPFTCSQLGLCERQIARRRSEESSRSHRSHLLKGRNMSMYAPIITAPSAGTQDLSARSSSTLKIDIPDEVSLSLSLVVYRVNDVNEGGGSRCRTVISRAHKMVKTCVNIHRQQSSACERIGGTAK
ncbi:MAG: hypothetical protein J07HQX50_01708 [Haloquadratum sp. J07HQX50]|nr:MAG: hypothetical protein J07HQX50_01708 [Haloquadratum sp. J07HQX50]